MELKQQIAANLEQAFSQYGFAEPSVSKLQKTSGVSLRTLYKHFPSKEAMVVGALAFRHQRYLEFLTQDAPHDNEAFALHTLTKLEHWMKQHAPHGCMSMNAISAFPNNPLVNDAVKQHKHEVRQLLTHHTKNEALAMNLMLVHEGVSSAWPIFGSSVLESAKQTTVLLFKHYQ
jgi:AcrR family transcriptional regulator